MLLLLVGMFVGAVVVLLSLPEVEAISYSDVITSAEPKFKQSIACLSTSHHPNLMTLGSS